MIFLEFIRVYIHICIEPLIAPFRSTRVHPPSFIKIHFHLSFPPTSKCQKLYVPFGLSDKYSQNESNVTSLESNTFYSPIKRYCID
jgi:hypothetical protein